MNILLVEDDLIDRMAVKRILRDINADCVLVEAEDGQEALDILHGESDKAPPPRPFIILLDLNMPRVNGIEFLRELRSENTDESIRDSVVFVLTTSSSENDRKLAYRNIVSGYMVKSDYTDGMAEIAKMLVHFDSVIDYP